MAKEKSKATAQNLDFSGVKERGNFNPKQVGEGDYSATITKVEDAKPKDGGSDPMYLFTIKLDKYSQYSYPYYCKLVENQLWKIRNLMVAAGKNVPKKKIKIDPNVIVGKKIGVTMADEEYEGKTKSVVDAVFPVSDLEGGVPVDDDDDEGFDEDDAPEVEEAPAKKSKKKAAAAEPAKKGKKKKGKKSDADVEDINIDDV